MLRCYMSEGTHTSTVGQSSIAGSGKPDCGSHHAFPTLNSEESFYTSNLWMSAHSHSIPATLHGFKTHGSCDLRPCGSDIVEATCGRYGHATRNGTVPSAGFDLWANSPNTLNI